MYLLELRFQYCIFFFCVCVFNTVLKNTPLLYLFFAQIKLCGKIFLFWGTVVA